MSQLTTNVAILLLFIILVFSNDNKPISIHLQGIFLMVRFKNRYFLVQVLPINVGNDSGDELLFASPSAIANLVKSAVEDNFGIATAARINPSLSIKYSSSDTHIIIVRCARDSAKAVWSSLTFIGEFPGRSDYNPRAIWQVMALSGTIRSCQIKAIKLHKRLIAGVFEHSELSQDARAKVNETLQVAEQTIRNLEA